MKNIFAIITTIILLAASCSVSHAVDVAGIEIHGFGSQGFVTGTSKNDNYVTNSGNGSFNFNEFGINFSKQVTPELRMAVQFIAYDRGDFGKDELKLDWAFVDYRWKDWLGFRVGQIKNALGLYTETLDNDTLRPFVFLPQSVYPECLRDVTVANVGAGIYGTVPLGRAGIFLYQVQGGTLPSLDTDSGLALIYTENIGLPPLTSIKGKKTFLFYGEYQPPIKGLRLVGSTIHTGLDIKSGALKFTQSPSVRTVFSAEYTWRDLVVAAEYALQDGKFEIPGVGRIDLSQGGWYVSAAYRFNDWLEIGAYHSEYYLDRNHPFGSNYQQSGLPNKENAYQQDTALSFCLDVVKNVRLKVEGHAIKGSASLFGSEYSEARKNSYLLATKVSYAF